MDRSARWQSWPCTLLGAMAGNLRTTDMRALISQDFSLLERPQDPPQWCRGGVRPAVGPLAVRQISTRYLIQDERIEIADLRRTGMSMRAIADMLGRAASTISRELRRNVSVGGGYQPFDAHRRGTARRGPRHRRRVDTNDQFGVLVAELLGRRWSPQQISRHVRLHFPDDRSMWLCHKRIYQTVYQTNSRCLRPTRLAPHRCSPAETTAAAHISVSGAAGRGSSSRRSPSMIDPSHLSTGHRQGTGRVI